jgi:hypothetical protein
MPPTKKKNSTGGFDWEKFAKVTGALAALITAVTSVYSRLPSSAVPADTTTTANPVADTTCRFVILDGGTDGVFSADRTIRVEIDRFDFRFEPGARSGAVFVMKNFDAGPRRIRVTSTWPTEHDPQLVWEHDHSGMLTLGPGVHYAVSPRVAPRRADPNQPLDIRAITQNEFATILASLLLAPPLNCEDYPPNRVSLADSVAPVPWGIITAGVAFVAFAIAYLMRRRRLARNSAPLQNSPR